MSDRKTSQRLKDVHPIRRASPARSSRDSLVDFHRAASSNQGDADDGNVPLRFQIDEPSHGLSSLGAALLLLLASSLLWCTLPPELRCTGTGQSTKAAAGAQWLHAGGHTVTAVVG